MGFRLDILLCFLSPRTHLESLLIQLVSDFPWVLEPRDGARPAVGSWKPRSGSGSASLGSGSASLGSGSASLGSGSASLGSNPRAEPWLLLP
jgi:hypothetical protein